MSLLNFHHCTLISDVAADAMFAGVVFGTKGDGVLAPTVLFAPDPEYSDKARKNKIQGTCGLSVVVGSDGHTRDITVIRPLEPSLDENAVEWKLSRLGDSGLLRSTKYLWRCE